MGIIKNGLHGEVTGKVGNLVYYTRKGKNVARTIGVNLNPPTEKQLASRQQVELMSPLLSKLLPFINVGFAPEILGKDLNCFNEAMSYNRRHALQGGYPNATVAYDRLRVSQGTLLPAQDPAVTQVSAGLEFSWAVDTELSWERSSDQVMMLAYFPETGDSYLSFFGNRREAGRDLLVIPDALQGSYMEVYISFVSADRKATANSTYLGNFNL
ncbi:DUF6266 family protein [Pedobacter faecalis]|uniref:DUF6266 family protein n=1 Tax=Pedobacter faecalis TaxID=3041495 RepID=UPI00254D975A|nr:DUF6266 family protein [Pedobacter sp. ELA7]